MVVITLLLLAGCRDAVPTPHVDTGIAEPPTVDGLSPLDAPRLLRRISLDLRGVLPNIDGISFIELDGSDVIRHRLVKAVIQAFEKSEETPPTKA